MNELYGVDPGSIHDVRELRTILSMFGLSHGRFIANVPKDWRDLLVFCSEQRQMQRSALVELLARSRDAFDTVDAPFNPKRPWLENALSIQDKRRLFHTIFSSVKGPFNEPTGDLVDHSFVLKDGLGEDVPATASEYARVAEQLIKRSEEILLVDRFFCLRHLGPGNQHRKNQPDLGRRNVLTHFWQVMVKWKRTRRFLIVFPAEFYNSADHEKGLTEDLNNIRESIDGGENLELIVKFLDLEDTHPRLLLSVKGGLSFDQGFQELKGRRNLVVYHPLSRLLEYQAKFLRLLH